MIKKLAQKSKEVFEELLETYRYLKNLRYQADKLFEGRWQPSPEAEMEEQAGRSKCDGCPNCVCREKILLNLAANDDEEPK